MIKLNLGKKTNLIDLVEETNKEHNKSYSIGILPY